MSSIPPMENASHLHANPALSGSFLPPATTSFGICPAAAVAVSGAEYCIARLPSERREPSLYTLSSTQAIISSAIGCHWLRFHDIRVSLFFFSVFYTRHILDYNNSQICWSVIRYSPCYFNEQHDATTGCCSCCKMLWMCPSQVFFSSSIRAVTKLGKKLHNKKDDGLTKFGKVFISTTSSFSSF